MGGHWLSVFLDPRKEMFKLTSDTKTVVKVKSITYELHIIYLKFIKFKCKTGIVLLGKNDIFTINVCFPALFK